MWKKSKSDEDAFDNMFTACPPFPEQPWIYITDPMGKNGHANNVQDMIDAAQFHYSGMSANFFNSSDLSSMDTLLHHLDKSKTARHISKKAFLIVDKLNRLDCENGEKMEAAKKIREHAAKSGRTFASVNLYMEEGTKEREMKKWGPHHLELCVADLTHKQVAEQVYKWLFTAIPPTEHIYLLTQVKLQVTDQKHYPDYEYCPLGDIKKHAKDAKIQFGVVITSKPVLVPGTQRLHWTVADKSGTGNFYFQYRGPTSQYTWDWVQSLQAGDIKSLPRMPSVQIRESRTVRVAKLPLRTASFAVSSVGLAIKGVGSGIIKVGDVLSMGKSTEYVPHGDVDKNGKKIDWAKKFEKEGKDRSEKVEKAKKMLTEKIAAQLAVARKRKNRGAHVDPEGVHDSDSDANTLCGSEKQAVVVMEKEFC
ncbi:hypothetical protein G647_08582 [Cladophialophora carrionii CBS 160.54]|uniref:Uncharacterized protein n=1 Tax=Cladophialophora carrionii CBS 160.54 TaxID=1279043 RepID=V9D0Y3_9EURO|nr:uncharacterized protein G647_08582 [Cladophialophora carrionii CBS 160.54]ETI20545.1 hypothetical protein G647_08582 [Cladophialophora carrionii CBS 160.54]